MRLCMIGQAKKMPKRQVRIAALWLNVSDEHGAAAQEVCNAVSHTNA